MINYRIIARVFSILLVIEGLLMLLSALVSYIYGEGAARSFLLSAIITIVSGVIVFTPLRHEEKVYGNREGYIIVTGIWILLSLFGTLPYLLTDSLKGFENAFFESISGFTTTGATVIPDIEALPKGILFWRSLTQWTGGAGIIFLSLYVLPVFRDINIQLTTTEFSGQPAGKIHPRAVDAAKRMIGIYILLTAIEILLLTVSGMPLFDAICNSFSTLSSGGFTTRNDSLVSFQTPAVKAIVTVFMFFSATNMAVVYYAFKRNIGKIKENSEFRFYLIIIAIFSVVVTTALIILVGKPFFESVQDGFFHVVSIISTTGFYTTDFTAWGNFVMFTLFILMFTGGTTGSAAGGVKITRLIIMTSNNRMELRRLIHPEAYIPVRLNRKIVPHNIVYNVLVFITLYFLVICASAVIISVMGYDVITSFGTSASMLANIGPGLGMFGPYHTYEMLPAAGKYFLSILMFLGRLEMMAVLILFSRSFYRR